MRLFGWDSSPIWPVILRKRPGQDTQRQTAGARTHGKTTWRHSRRQPPASQGARPQKKKTCWPLDLRLQPPKKIKFHYLSRPDHAMCYGGPSKWIQVVTRHSPVSCWHTVGTHHTGTHARTHEKTFRTENQCTLLPCGPQCTNNGCSPGNRACLRFPSHPALHTHWGNIHMNTLSLYQSTADIQEKLPNQIQTGCLSPSRLCVFWYRKKILYHSLTRVKKKKKEISLEMERCR